MTQDEFHKWFQHHLGCFSAISAWAAKQGQGVGGKIELAKRWFGVLRGVSLEDAMSATDRMYAGDIERPRGFEEHAAAIKKACRSARQRDGSGPAGDPRCICEGTGFVSVMADGAFKTAGGAVMHRGSVLVACHCPRGQWVNECHKRAGNSGFPEFNPEWMRIESEVRRAELAKWREQAQKNSFMQAISARNVARKTAANFKTVE